MSRLFTRRRLLTCTVAVGAAAVLVPVLPRAGSGATRNALRSREIDPRVAAVRELSRDAAGTVHIDQVAFLDGGRAPVGTLPVSRDEAADLRARLASGEFAPLQQRGLRLGGTKYVFIRADREDVGVVVHAVARSGGFATLRAVDDRVVIATSGPDMVHNRAVEALYQHLKRAAAVA